MTASDPAWPLVEQWLESASNRHRFTSAAPDVAAATLDALPGITERSVLGALALHVQALWVDDWLLVLGAGGEGHPGILDFNGGAANVPALPDALVAGVDVLGGAFAINGGGLPVGDPGEVCYLGPDTLDWLDCGLGHAEFVSWSLQGDVDRFYADLRWDEWRALTSQLAPGQGVSAYPPPWSKEGRAMDVSRRPVPLLEVYGVLLSTVAQVTGWGPGPQP